MNGRSLTEIQRWMQVVITHPDGVVAGAESDAARREIDIAAAGIESIIQPSRQMTGEERLSIYGNAYFARLLECLRTIFPLVARTIGDEAFDELAMGYLGRYPSRSYTLDRLGDRFMDYLSESRPDLDTQGRPTERWPDFLIDLARLEWEIDEVFDGPGVEGRPLLTAEALQTIEPARWPDARLAPAPCLRLLEFSFPVNDYYTALRKADEDGAPDIPEPAGTFLALTRRSFIVRRHALSEVQYSLLGSLMAGETIGGAIGRLASRGDCDLKTLAADLQAWFRAWTAAGFFMSVEVDA
ncbi:MAG TPA: DNA-binding domain-containing protein [Pirellulales bacterium]|nr:DNA-binding domain-containing protein [Pirellulales bacterium]